MKIAIVAPSSVPFTIGGAESLWWGLLDHLNQRTAHQAELIKLPSPERDFWEVLASYESFSRLDLSHFDLVISTKYPAWMVCHPRHVVYLQHRLRGLYDTYSLTGLPLQPRVRDSELAALGEFAARNAGRRDALPEFFARASVLRERCEELREETGFPGPLIREWIHYLDGVGLSACAISRWAAISRNVARRPRYFPIDVEPQVVHHPSALRSFRNTGEDYLFTIARLDSAKRVELLVRAMAHVRAPIPLKIAGTGPEEENLRQLAAADPRIEFLGFVTDREAETLYAGALAVPYVPYDEDYGLVTVEAMQCGKPVLTTTDAGGPNEFVESGVTGLCVEPDPLQLGEAIDRLCADRAQARALGLAGRERVREISWDRVIEVLLGEAGRPCAPHVRRPRTRPRLAVATTFAIHPPEHGGQVRLFELLRRLALEFDVEVVALGRPGETVRRSELVPGLLEVVVPPSDAHVRAETALSGELGWLPVTDIALPSLYKHSPRWLEALESALGRADAVIASHPFTLPAIESVSPGIVLLYDAQDVEFDLKRRALEGSEKGRRLLVDVRQVEERCCAASALVLACSEIDGARFTELYGLSSERCLVVSNGVDVNAIPYVRPAEREARKRALGLGDVYTGLFIGSWHPPNIDAVRSLSQIAARRPEMRFLVVGGVGGAFAREQLAANVGLLGVVDGETKELVSSVSDVALNPMSWGSGTNLKMLEYCAAGIPVLTTECGARGLSLRADDHILTATLDEFPDRLVELRSDAMAVGARVEAARLWVQRHYDWDGIAERLAAAIRNCLERPRHARLQG